MNWEQIVLSALGLLLGGGLVGAFATWRRVGHQNGLDDRTGWKMLIDELKEQVQVSGDRLDALETTARLDSDEKKKTSEIIRLLLTNNGRMRAIIVQLAMGIDALSEQIHKIAPGIALVFQRPGVTQELKMMGDAEKKLLGDK